MTVREWFRQMRSTEHGVSLACEIDRLLTHPRLIETVYGIGLTTELVAGTAIFDLHAHVWAANQAQARRWAALL